MISVKGYLEHRRALEPKMHTAQRSEHIVHEHDYRDRGSIKVFWTLKSSWSKVAQRTGSCYLPEQIVKWTLL